MTKYKVYDIINSSNEERIFPYVFLTGSVVMLIGMLVVLFKVKEPDSRLKAVAEQNMAMDEKARAAAEKQARKEEKAQRKAQHDFYSTLRMTDGVTGR